jgi:hypothetical protein
MLPFISIDQRCSSPNSVSYARRSECTTQPGQLVLFQGQVYRFPFFLIESRSRYIQNNDINL